MAEYDVAVLGAGIAGSTVATFLGRQGLRVALVERHRSHEVHKVLCTHFIQASAAPTVRRLGLTEPIGTASAPLWHSSRRSRVG